jgi:hypothetical protein
MATTTGHAVKAVRARMTAYNGRARDNGSSQKSGNARTGAKKIR